MINRGGNKVHPDAVEEVLRLVPGVDDAAVVGGPTSASARSRWRSWSATRYPTTSCWRCPEHLVAYKVPVALHWLDELPRSEVGKVLTATLQARLT